MSRHAAGSGPERGSYQDPPTKPRRKRVVLADSRAPVTVLRTVVELEEQTSYGEELVSQYIRTQFRTSIRFWIGTILLLAVIPAVFFLVPPLSEVSFAGVRLPWLVIGVLPFPLLFGAGYWYNLVVERQEKDFVAMVEK
ncbi:MAG: hypothetical protein GEV28_10440 [Actinophytocola sp.]|uniref:hypothetical protein n=1 Tax=Actinophytocola sp. TaxID=1872138 RepID=UPI00132BB53C|nr:hypothetical protein [Actinophytocola sp.]MPZ80782.1 hypothetical protein [Actinophytocola sp.]